jgi:light-regulated signal transduction histidine kinase (bacteriophytochrome)
LPIKDFASLFDKEYKGKLGAEADQYIEFIVQATERMKSLVKAVLSYSRIGKGKELASIDCNLLVKGVVNDLSMRLKETNTKIHIEELPIIKGYRTELHSLFHNLITNAVKYRKKDVNPKIWITWERDDKYWKFSVRDNGIGIEEKNKERVFNIFQRLNNMNSYEGTGIGLAQSKKIVEIHNGSIWVDSVYGEGSTFSFRIKNFDK